MAQGRKKIFTPESLLETFKQYCQWAKENPIKVHDFVGKDGTSVYRERERPLIMEGFETFCWDNDICDGLEPYFSNREGRYSDFVAICSRIKQAIRNDQISGGMAGIYVPSITQRLNNLKEATTNEHTVTGTVIQFAAPDPKDKPISE